LFIEENFELLKARGGDPTNKRFQVGAYTSEHKLARVRKSDMYRDWRMHKLPLYITVGNGVRKADKEHLKLGHG
jgi:hypothetical protein